MTSKETRRKILEFLYQKNEEGNKEVGYKDLQKNIQASNIELQNAINYLKNDGYIHAEPALGNPFYMSWIKNKGIDLVENSEEFGKLFSVNIQHIEKIENSGNGNVQIAKDNSSQKISQNNIPPEILEQLKIAIEKKDKSLLFKTLEELEDGAKTVFWTFISTLVI